MDFKYDDKIPSLKDLGTGNVYIVCQTTNTALRAEMVKKYANKYYSDGTAVLHSTIQSGLDACMALRNDKVLVCPDGYTLTAGLTMSKACVHLICPAGLGCDVGATNAARLTAYAGTDAITVTAASCEIAGLYIKNANTMSGIRLGAGSHATHVHHNHLPLIWSSTAAQASSIISAGTGTMQNIEKNFIFNYTGGASTTCAGGYIRIEADGYMSRVSGNIIIVGDGATATYGIIVQGANQLISNNIISESGTSTCTTAVSGTTTTSFVGNRCAVRSGAFSDGSGTTGRSYVDNMDGICDGAGALTAQLET